jgi:hypothetical protein
MYLQLLLNKLISECLEVFFSEFSHKFFFKEALIINLFINYNIFSHLGCIKYNSTQTKDKQLQMYEN